MDESPLKEAGKEKTPRAVEERLRRLAKAAGAVLLAGGLGKLLLSVEVFFFVTLALDRTFELEKGFRAALLAAGGVGILLTAWKRLLQPLLRPIPELELALALERGHPFLRQALVSAFQFHRKLLQGGPFGGESPLLAEKAVEQGEALAARIRAARALEGRKLRRHFFLLAGAIFVLAGTFTAMPATISLWAKRQILLSDLSWPRRTTLEILGVRKGVLYTPKGEDLAVLVRAGGVIPSKGTITWTGPSGSGEDRLTRFGRDRFRYLFKALTDPLTFSVAAGDGKAGPVKVIPLARPAVLSLTARVREPAYTGRTPARVDLLASGGTLRVLRGSTVILQGRADKRLSRARIASGRESLPGRVDPRDPGKFTFTLKPERSLTLQVLPADDFGLEPNPAPAVTLTVLPDLPPALTLSCRGVGAMVTPRVRIPLVLKARDDVALSTLAIQQSLDPPDRNQRNFRTVPVRGLEAFEPGAPSFEGDLLWTRGKTELLPGRTLSLRARAEDRFSPPPPHRTFSGILEFKVVPEEVLRQELNRRQEEVRSQLEGLQESLQALRKDLAARPRPEQGLPGELQADSTRSEGAALRLAGILDEWENNRLPGWDRVPSLRRMLVAPLQERAAPALAKGAEEASAWLSGTKGSLQALRANLDRALEALARVLANLARVESFEKVLELTRNLMRTQDRAKEALKKKLEKSLDELFGGKKR